MSFDSSEISWKNVKLLCASLCLSAFVVLPFACGQNNKTATSDKDSLISCEMDLPSRAKNSVDTTIIKQGKNSTEGMVLVPAGDYMMGSSDDEGRPDEYPQKKVSVKSFWMDATEVTNAQFAEFVKATGFVTTAERKPDWEELKKQLPEGTEKPDEKHLVAASLVFKSPTHAVSLNDASQWWEWTAGADWKHPQGPGSNINGKENFPVVHVSWDDAMAYCKWSGKRLPTEAEWEYAAHGGLQENKYPWGNEDPETGKPKTNTWQGDFPVRNLKKDGFERAAPVRSFQPNGYQLYDMAGNVWEWCIDEYSDPMEPTVPKKVIKGGSFLCNASYCKGYRVSSKMKTSPDTGLEHTGFRCVKEVNGE